MFKELLKEFIKITEKVEDISNILFSSNNICRDKYNLSYLGEVLERHEERGFSLENVLDAISFGFSQKANFIDNSINTNQLSLFKAKFKDLCDIQYNPYSHIGYIFLMLHVEEENYESEILSFLNKNKLDEAFLLLVEALKDGFFPINDDIKKAIVSKLQEEKFIVNFVDLINLVKSNFSCSYSVYCNIRDIIKIFGFKSKDFTNKEVFKILDSYKKIGTNRISQVDSFNMLKCFGESEDVFWLLNLKIARETLSKGGNAFETASSYFKSCISKTINISRINFELFSKIKDISFRYVDFSALKESRYDKLIYLLERRDIDVSNIGKEIYTSTTFIDQLKNSLANSAITHTVFMRICLDIVKDTEEMLWKEFFFNLIKENNCSLDYSEYAVLHEEGLIEFKDCLGANLRRFLDSLYQSITYSDEKLAVNVLLAFRDGYINSENIYTETLSGYSRERYYSRISIVDFVYNNVLSYIDSISKENKEYAIEMIQSLETFLFSTSYSKDSLESNYYVKLIIKALDNKLYLEALKLSKDDVKEIAQTLLSFDCISNSKTLHHLNTHAYSKKEANLLKLEIKYDTLKNHILERYRDISITEINAFFKEAEELDVKENYTNLLCEFIENSSSLPTGKYCIAVVCLFSLDIISKEKRDSLVMKRIDSMCVKTKESISVE